MWIRFVLFPLALAAAAAAVPQQPPELFRKAPPEVEQALRARMAAFYQSHVDGKHRLAEDIVAPDARDFFYESNKPRYLSFEIARIEYSDDFTRAKATVMCEQYVNMPGFAGKPLKVPTPSTWKLEAGKWYWWVDPAQLRETPFGALPSNTKAAAGAPQRPHIPDASEMAFITTQVKADRAAVSLTEGGEAEVRFTSSAAGLVRLVVPAARLGLDLSLDRAELKQGETAVLRLKRPAGARAATGALEIVVEPTNQRIAIGVELP
jgi:hypothetical protein